MSETAPLPGRFVWCDLKTTDLEASKSFYLGLFPTWERTSEGKDAPGPYERLTVSGRGIGGMMALRPGSEPRSHWVPYASVKSVDDTCAKVTELGGAIRVPPMDIPHVGRFATVADPQGALFAVIALADEPPEHSGPMPAGAFCWHELLTTDAASAAGFYTAVLGWSHAEVPLGSSPYHLFRRGERDAAGMVQVPAGAAGPPEWLAYVYTSDMDASVARVAQLGGRVVRPPAHVPGVGTFAVAADPMGAKLALFRSERG